MQMISLLIAVKATWQERQLSHKKAHTQITKNT